MEHIHYLVDDTGKKTAVVIPLEGNETALEEFIEDLYGSCVIEQRKDDKIISKESFMKELKDEGLL
jgi:hypothetical protein